MNTDADILNFHKLVLYMYDVVLWSTLHLGLALFNGELQM